MKKPLLVLLVMLLLVGQHVEATEQFADSVSTTLSGSQTLGATTASITSATGFPTTAGGTYSIAVDSGANYEIETVTAISGTTLTVTRGENARFPAVAHNSGVPVTIIETARARAQLKTDVVPPTVSTSAAGLAPQLDNTVTHFLNGQGGYTTPAGTGGTINSGTAGQFAEYGANGTTLSGVSTVYYVDGINYALNATGIQAALNAAGTAGGGAVQLPNASINNAIPISTGLSIPSAVTLKGNGPGATVLNYTGAAGAMITMGNGSAAILHANLKDLTIYRGTSQSGDICFSMGGNNSTGHNAQQDRVEDVECRYGTYLAGTTGFSFTGTANPADVALDWVDNISVFNAALGVTMNDCEQMWFRDVDVDLNLGETTATPKLSIGSLCNAVYYIGGRMAGALSTAGAAANIAGFKNHILFNVDSGSQTCFNDTGARNWLECTDTSGLTVTFGNLNFDSHGTFNGIPVENYITVSQVPACPLFSIATSPTAAKLCVTNLGSACSNGTTVTTGSGTGTTHCQISCDTANTAWKETGAGCY